VPENDLVFVDIDVSKAHLVVAVHGQSEVRRVPNDEAGIVKLVSDLAELSPALLVLEATGGFEMPGAVALAAVQVPLVIATATASVTARTVSAQSPAGRPGPCGSFSPPAASSCPQRQV